MRASSGKLVAWRKAHTTARSSSVAQRAVVARAIGVLEAIVKSYSVPDDRSLDAIHVVRAGLHGFADIEVRGGFQLPQPLDESFQTLVDAMLRTLGRRQMARDEALICSRQRLPSVRSA